MGGVLSELRGVHGEHLDSGGSKAPYQLARIKRSISCPSMLCETPEQFPHFTPNGQPSGHNLHQQKGGHEIKSTLRPSSQGVDMVLGEVNYSGGKTSPWPPKHSGGLREPSLSDSGDWHLNKAIFKMMTNQMGDCSIDLFASYKNTQLKKFYSWRPDPLSLAVDALAQSWKSYHQPYLFLPVSLIGPCLQKIREDGVQAALLVAPLWPSQTWFPVLLGMTTDVPRLLPSDWWLVTDPLGNPHPLQIQERLNLVVWPILGDLCKHKEFADRLPISTVPHGEGPPHHLTAHAGRDGSSDVVQNKQIPLRLL